MDSADAGLGIACSGSRGSPACTWREQRGAVVHDFHALAVALRIRGAGARAARLGPVCERAAPSAQPERAHARRPRQLQQYPARHGLASVEHGLGARARPVQLHHEGLHLVEQHRADRREPKRRPTRGSNPRHGRPSGWERGKFELRPRTRRPAGPEDRSGLARGAAGSYTAGRGRGLRRRPRLPEEAPSKAPVGAGPERESRDPWEPIVWRRNGLRESHASRKRSHQ